MSRQLCSLNMLHRTCENMHGRVGLGGLSMPNGWCILHMPIYFKPWSIKSTLFHVWCRLHLTIFLLAVGLLTFM